MNTLHKIVDRNNAVHKAEAWKNAGMEVVFTNGCFDILHAGHIQVLEQAKSKGDKLIVALNTDQSVQQLKGKNRPIQNEQTRTQVMAALQCVDMVVLFDEETPLQLIEAIQPDVLVKGGDYIVEEIVGYATVIEHGGKVEIIPFLNDYSTTNVIKKIIETK